MARYSSFVCVLVTILLPAKSLFAGEGCVADNQSGNCGLLDECHPILTEIKKAGSPMPLHIRRKLQELHCGFHFNQPLVCCVTPTDINDQETPAPTWPVDKTPNRGKPEPNTGSHEVFPNPLNRDPTDGVQNNDARNTIQNHRNFHLLPTNCGVFESDRIWGGKRTRLFEMPWMVLIAYDSARGRKLSCGGTLISEWYVLTAAHCVSFLGSRLTLSGVVLGEHDVRKDPDCERVEGKTYCAPSARNVSIDEIIAHPGYRPQTLFDDIALIRLAEPADFSLDNMKPICLPTTPQLRNENLVGVSAVAAGWGATEDGLQSSVLLNVDLPVISNDDCKAAYNGSIRIYEGQMCAGGVPDKDSCGGDSGGPLMYPGIIGTLGLRYIQRGIVSYGSKRCGIGGFPGVYTRVGHYMEWILDNMRD